MDKYAFMPKTGALLLAALALALLYAPAGVGAQEKTGFLKLTSDPRGATVKVDGRVYGKTPVLLELPAGKHSVSVSKEGFKKSDKRLNIKENTVLRSHVTLKALPEGEEAPAPQAAKIQVHKLEESNEPGTVTIVTTPPGLTVFMNDYLVPQPTPVAFDLRAGVYEMVIEDENGTAVYKKTVFVYPGRTVDLDLDIKKIRRIDYEDPWK